MSHKQAKKRRKFIRVCAKCAEATGRQTRGIEHQVKLGAALFNTFTDREKRKAGVL